MTAREALVERAKKAGDVSRYQLRVYIGANDYLYERVRRTPAALPELPGKLGQITDDRAQPVRRAVRSYTPAKLREVVQTRVEAARERRDEFAERGETIIADWTQALAVQDANSLIRTVRNADGAADLAKSLKTWLAEFPPADAHAPAAKPAARSAAKPAARPASKPTGTAARKAAARKTAARKTAARKTVARKTAARKTAATTPAATAPVVSTPPAGSTD